MVTPRRQAPVLLPLALLVGCAAPSGGGGTSPSPTPAPTEPAGAAPVAAQLSPREALIRASLDLRGVRPTEAEYQQVAADPAAVGPMIEGFLADPRFAARVREIFAPILRTRIDSFPVHASAYGIEDDAAFQAAVGEEALRMVSWLVEHNRPYTELVTGNWSMANELLGKAWPVDYPEGETGWRQVSYTDGRPGAGVLSTNSLWWRYPSNGANYNRGRANAVADLFLCASYLTRPVTFDATVDLSDPEQVSSALRSNPTCVACHISLDPLGSYLFGFSYVSSASAEDASIYHPERERDWQSTTGVAPAFFGTPGYTLRDLGQQVAADPRYVSCVVERIFESMVGRPATEQDMDALTRHREHFLAGGLTLAALFRSVATDPSYLGTLDTSQGLPRKLVSPETYASQVEDLTSYRFTVEGVDQLRVDRTGLRGLAGGGDGLTGGGVARVPIPSALLVFERIAQGAAGWVVEQDAVAAERRLFTKVRFTETTETDPAAMAAQLQHLHWRLYGREVAADGPEVSAGLSLWSSVYASHGDIQLAWAQVLSVLLRDPDFLFY